MTLFDNHTLLRHDAPDTSAAAAVRAFPKSGTARARVLDLLQEIYPQGRTDEQIQEELQMPANTERPRRVELVDGGWVEDSGVRITSASGTASIVWVYRL